VIERVDPTRAAANVVNFMKGPPADSSGRE
jgi:hypothetical protein